MEIQSSACEAACTIDPGGNILTWNDGATELFGYSPAEAIGLHFYHVCDPFQLVDGSLERLLAEAYRAEYSERRFQCVCKDGVKFSGTLRLKTIWEEQRFCGYAIRVQPD